MIRIWTGYNFRKGQVTSRHSCCKMSCPLYLRKWACAVRQPMSAMCRKRTCRPHLSTCQYQPMRVIVGWGPDADRRLLMLQISSLLPLFLLTAVITHLVMSFGQTLMHYKLGHHRMGGRFFHNHINFHHTYYSKDHLVSRTYLGDEGNNTPFFFIPVFLAGGCAYFILPLNLFVVMVIASAASFYAHVFFDKEYHVEGSRLQRFAWFRRKQELHFVHHRHANYNFAVIHFFWDRLLGTYRRPDAGA
jgi:sterol desaturase/sphingolipid hydroxylase (fatty acid hydroxylase superfamily)